MADGPQFDRVLFPINCKPGVKRDGTTLDGNFYSDAKWCRFRIGRPKKIGGYREIANGLTGPIRAVYTFARHPDQLIYTFSDSGIQMTAVDDEGVGGSPVNRTPAGFTSETGYLWHMDTMYDSTGGGGVKIIAHRCHGDEGDSSENYPVYFGDATGSAALAQFATPQSVSGGVVVLQPFLFIYGNNGLIKNSIANDPSTFAGGDSNSANVAGSKIVHGIPLRGGSNAPAGMFWSLDSLIRVTYVGGTAKWRYDTITANTSILAPKSAVDYDGVFYWIGVDRFLMYNGVVKEVPNAMNQDFFFNNLNWAYRDRVWGTTLPRWGEIWWFFPKGDSTECNWAIIYNVREDSWYDTPIDRSSGAAPRILYFPVWADALSNTDTGSTAYRIYRHETGTDAVVGEDQVAIESYFETSDLGFASGAAGQGFPNVQTRIARIEPDFVQTEEMTVEVGGSSHAQAEQVSLAAQAFDADTPYIDYKPTQLRLISLKFSSNVQGGDFHMGKVLLHLEVGDQRQ